MRKPMTEKTAIVAPSSGSVTLRFLELCQFRRLGKVQIDIDEKTTILVGANNSGKTSVLAALRHFLSDGLAFGAFDISHFAMDEVARPGQTVGGTPRGPRNGCRDRHQ